MKKTPVLLFILAVSCGLPLSGRAALDSDNGFDETLNFSNNQTPPGWQIAYPYGGPGRDAQIANQRFQIGPTDTYASLQKNKTLPVGSTAIHIAYKCAVQDVVYGMGYQIHLVMNDGGDFFVDLSKNGFGVDNIVAAAGDYSAPEFDQTYPPRYQDYILDAVFSNGQIVLQATKANNGAVLLNVTVPVPDLDITRLQQVRLFGIMTTEHVSSPAWIDNVVIEALP
ncbi:MAG TPA: hypothetical protein VGG02_05620 [Chthoniobacterales bacterium]|jgi:hypothetical protein